MTGPTHNQAIAKFSSAAIKHYEGMNRSQPKGSYITPESVASEISGMAAQATVLDREMRVILAEWIAAYALRLALDSHSPSDVEAMLSAMRTNPVSLATDGNERTTPRSAPGTTPCPSTVAWQREAWPLLDHDTKAAPPRRITPAMVDDQITDEAFHIFPGTGLTICALTLTNGHILTGESRPLDPAAFDAEIGRDAAKAKARQQIFKLLAFRARDEIAQRSAAA